MAASCFFFHDAPCLACREYRAQSLFCCHCGRHLRQASCFLSARDQSGPSSLPKHKVFSKSNRKSSKPPASSNATSLTHTNMMPLALIGFHDGFPLWAERLPDLGRRFRCGRRHRKHGWTEGLADRTAQGFVHSSCVATACWSIERGTSGAVASCSAASSSAALLPVATAQDTFPTLRQCRFQPRRYSLASH